MRKALNENPVVQAVVIGVMALLVAFLLFTRVLSSGGEEAAPTGDSPSAEATPAGETATPATPAPSDAPAPEAASATPAPAPTTGETPPATGTAPVPGAAVPAPAGNAFEAGPGLPKAVVSAYDNGDAVVLLIEKQKGLDDRAVKGSVERLRSRGDTAVFVVPAADVSKYARITEGVQLSRTPAIVVLRPKRLTKGDIPEATVSYGFRGPESVEQALDDALYKGKNVTYDP